MNDNSTCRSIQLLRYFGEKTRKKCGKCDVCNNDNRIGLGDNDYKEISNLIYNDLDNGSFHISEAPQHAKGYFEEKVFEVVRIMIDNGVIIQDEEGLLRGRKRR